MVSAKFTHHHPKGVFVKVPSPLSFLYGYRVTAKGIEFTIFNDLFTIKKIPFESVDSIKIVKLGETLKPDLTTLRLGNKVFSEIVEVRLKRSKLSRILITPDDPQLFITEWERFRRSS